MSKTSEEMKLILLTAMRETLDEKPDWRRDVLSVLYNAVIGMGSETILFWLDLSMKEQLEIIHTAIEWKLKDLEVEEDEQ